MRGPWLRLSQWSADPSTPEQSADPEQEFHSVKINHEDNRRIRRDYDRTKVVLCFYGQVNLAWLLVVLWRVSTFVPKVEVVS